MFTNFTNPDAPCMEYLPTKLDHYWGKCNYIDIPYMEHLGKDLGHHLSIELLLCHPRCLAGIVSFCSMIFPAINLHELLRVL